MQVLCTHCPYVQNSPELIYLPLDLCRRHMLCFVFPRECSVASVGNLGVRVGGVSEKVVDYVNGMATVIRNLDY